LKFWTKVSNVLEILISALSIAKVLHRRFLADKTFILKVPKVEKLMFPCDISTDRIL